MELIGNQVFQLSQAGLNYPPNIIDVFHLIFLHEEEEIAGLGLVHPSPGFEKVLQSTDIVAGHCHRENIGRLLVDNLALE